MPRGAAAAGGSVHVGLVCTRCGHRNAEASRFCSNCGAPLRAGAPPERAVGDDVHDLHLRPRGVRRRGRPARRRRRRSPRRRRRPSTRCRSGSALLVVRRGPNSGSRFLLDGELTTAGRHPQSDIFLDDVTVSRRHVEFRRGADGVFTVADVGSLNGTYVNRERIDSVAAVQRRRGADRQVPAGLLREPAGRLTLPTVRGTPGKVHAANTERAVPDTAPPPRTSG